MSKKSPDRVDLPGRPALRALAVAALLFLALPASAQNVDELEARHTQTAREIMELGQAMTLSQERIAEINEQIAAIRMDSAAISAGLIQAVKTERKLTQDIADIASRLDVLADQERDIRGSLATRRGVLAEVLGALQRIGLNPPPAILVTPEDALSSVRSSILLAAVVPELRAETEIMIGDLRELTRVMVSIETERGRLHRTVTDQAAEKRRLSLLLDERRALQQRSEQVLAAEQERAERLAEEAGSLRELIDALESDIEIARREAEEARIAASSGAQEAPSAARERPGMLTTMAFSALRGQVGLPVSGRIERRFGEGDSDGGKMLGDMVATHSGAIVTAPTDGAVLYAGPFRSYGQLLILDAGEGYHVVLAGMGRISVAPGQQVLAGEPVGVMGEARVASAAAFESGSTGPELYVEFRQEGKPVDPAPWWAERYSGRTENDS